MLPKLVRTYPHKVDNQGIAMVPLFLRFILLQVICNQLKSLSNLTFTNILAVFFVIVYFEICLDNSCVHQKRNDNLVLTGENVNFISLLSVIRNLIHKLMQYRTQNTNAFIWKSFDKFSAQW